VTSRSAAQSREGSAAAGDANDPLGGLLAVCELEREMEEAVHRLQVDILACYSDVSIDM
jgi:hypothetical protein